MNNLWVLVSLSFFLSFIITILTVTPVKILAFKFNIVDHPKERGVHTKKIPLMGGLSIYLGFITTVIILGLYSKLFDIQMIGFVFGVTIIVFAGILDDMHNLKAYQKLFFQILSAVIIISTGTKIEISTYPILNNLGHIFDYIFTLIWIVGFTNAVNLVDGVDGLAAGISTISSIFLMILCILTGDTLLSILFTSALAGSCLGFLPRNFSPAEIFMGDTGSTFLGFVLSVSSIMGVFKSYALISIIIISLAIALPVIDTAFAIIRRLLSGKPIMQADRGHLHHKLLDNGYSHSSTVLILYGISFIGGLTSLAVAIEDITAILLILMLIIVVSIMVYTYKKRVK